MNKLYHNSFPGLKSAGFTLIELLVVVLIIGILSAVALPQYTRAVEKSRASEGITLVRAAAQAQKAFYLANGEYTADFSSLDFTFPGNASGSCFNTKNFSVCLHDVNASTMHIQAMRLEQGATGLWYIIFYTQRDKLDCVAPASDAAANRFCRSFNPVSEACPETGYNCYAV